MIDEGRIPLLLAMVDPQARSSQELTLWAADRVRTLEESRDFHRESHSGRWILTPAGSAAIRNSLPAHL
ncbi:MAG: hypothetical protein ACKOJF_17805, partial [Planctomycetaceae bacterium]